MSFNTDIQKPTVDGLITLFELDASKLGAGVLRFHGHNHERNDGVITFRGKAYNPQALSVTGLEMRSDGRASTPTLTLANNIAGVQGAVSALCRLYDDFARAKLTVTHTLQAYLDSHDAQNYRQQEWYIEQKVSENPSLGIVEFELSNPVDFEGQKIPVRQITTYCNEAVCGRYRGEICGYTGTARFTHDGKPTDDPTLDRCSGLLAHCKLRDNEGSFCGFPAAGLVG